VPNWSAEHVRLTVFPEEDLRHPDPNWWRALIGQDPQAKTIQQGIGIQESGAFRDNYCGLSLELQANRIDWLMAPLVRPNERPTSFPAFDSYPQAFIAFRELFERWLPTVPNIRRIAIGSVLTAQVADKAEGYRELGPLLPSVRLDPANSSDFSYSINRHATSPQACPNLHINRISSWSVALLTGIQIQIDGPGAGVSMRETGGVVSAIRLQLDINTAADRTGPLPNECVVPLFRELLTFAERIVEHGDIP